MRLDVSLVHRLRFEFAFYDDVSLSKTLFDVSNFVLDMSRDVTLDTGVVSAGETFHAEEGGHVVVQQGGIIGHGLAPGEHGGKDLVVHFHQIQGFQCDMGTGGADRGHRMAHIQDFVLGQQVLGDHARVALYLGKVDHPVLDDGKIGRGGNGHHTR